MSSSRDRVASIALRMRLKMIIKNACDHVSQAFLFNLFTIGNSEKVIKRYVKIIRKPCIIAGLWNIYSAITEFYCHPRLRA